MERNTKVVVKIAGEEAYRGRAMIYNSPYQRAVKIESSERHPEHIGKILVFDVATSLQSVEEIV